MAKKKKKPIPTSTPSPSVGEGFTFNTIEDNPWPATLRVHWYLVAFVGFAPVIPLLGFDGALVSICFLVAIFAGIVAQVMGMVCAEKYEALLHLPYLQVQKSVKARRTDVGICAEVDGVLLKSPPRRVLLSKSERNIQTRHEPTFYYVSLVLSSAVVRVKTFDEKELQEAHSFVRTLQRSFGLPERQLTVVTEPWLGRPIIEALFVVPQILFLFLLYAKIPLETDDAGFFFAGVVWLGIHALIHRLHVGFLRGVLRKAARRICVGS